MTDIPMIYDAERDRTRAATQGDLDLLVRRVTEKHTTIILLQAVLAAHGIALPFDIPIYARECYDADTREPKSFEAKQALRDLARRMRYEDYYRELFGG